MNKRNFIDTINDETLAKMIDATINFEKKQKSEKAKSSLFKIIPAAAAFLLIIGLVNITNLFSFGNINQNDNGNDEEDFFASGAETVIETPAENIVYEDLTYLFEGSDIDWVRIVERFWDDKNSAIIYETEINLPVYTHTIDKENWKTGTVDIEELICKVVIDVYKCTTCDEDEDCKAIFVKDVINNNDEADLAEIIARYYAVQSQMDKESNDVQEEIHKLLGELQSNSENHNEYIGGEMIYPLDEIYDVISYGFGHRVNPVTQEPEFHNVHNGFDIAAPYGANIYAVNDGMVILSEYNEQYGNYIIIDHGGGITTLYAQASSLLKKTGDTVIKGDIIATVGSTGWATGNHLHFEYRENGVPQGIIPGSKHISDINSDFYGWIKINGTRIDYPVVQGQDNEFYLNHDFKKRQNNSGAIFADFRNDRDVLKNYSTALYGHNMLDGSMFADLIKFGQDEELFQNGIIELCTSEAIYKYQVFSVYETGPDDPLSVDISGDSMLASANNIKLAFAYEVKSRSIFQKDDINLTEESRIITLCTWVNDSAKKRCFIVHGVLIAE